MPTSLNITTEHRHHFKYAAGTQPTITAITTIATAPIIILSQGMELEEGKPAWA